MVLSQIIEREWVVGVSFDDMRIRCWYRRQGNRILEYTVQLELRKADTWLPVVRYDDAHGFCHCDTIHPDGTQDKTPIYRGDANSNFTWAIREIRANWRSQVDRFLTESTP